MMSTSSECQQTHSKDEVIMLLIEIMAFLVVLKLMY